VVRKGFSSLTRGINPQAFLPESARWLLLAGKPDQAKRSLRWARGKYGRDAMMLDAEFEEMLGMTGDLSERRGALHLSFGTPVRCACVLHAVSGAWQPMGCMGRQPAYLCTQPPSCMCLARCGWVRGGPWVAKAWTPECLP
jgi:hypothetical protein